MATSCRRALGWTHDPYGAAIEDGRWPGHVRARRRGLEVGLRDLCVRAARAAGGRSEGARLRGTVELHLTYDEEAGGEIGPRWLLEHGLSKPDLVIAAGFSYAVVNAHNGCLHLEVTVTGKQAHAAMPETGRDALEAATGILTALYASRAALARIKSQRAGHLLARRSTSG